MSQRLIFGPKPRLGYTESAIDRAAQTRMDSGAVAALQQRPEARAYMLGGEMIVLHKAESLHDPLFTIAEAQELGADAEIIFIGLEGNAPRFAIGLGMAAATALKARDELLVSDLRTIAVKGLVEREQLPPLAQAKALLGWHMRHRYCPNCGTRTELAESGWRRDCTSCKAQHFPRTDPVVIMLPISAGSCVLGRSYRFQRGMWSCLAGFMEPGEAIEEAVRRETREEVGILCGQVRYFASQPWPFPSSVMIGCHAQALSHELVIDRTELDDARWFARDEVAAMLLRRHPEGLTTPPEVAIAYHIIRAWLEKEVDLG